MKIVKTILIIISLIATYQINGQVAITADGSQPDGSAMLEVESTSKGLLPPRMTEEERDAISSPAAGLMLWCTNCGDNGEMQVYNGTNWTNLTGGEASGVTVPFTCGNDFTDTRDDQTYATTLIGTQCWMAENLNVGAFINSSTQQTSGIPSIEKYCYYNLESNCDDKGGLYQWGEMVQYYNGATNNASWNPVPTGNVQGICPEGWHIPTSLEWTTVIGYISAYNNGEFNGTEGTALKSSTADWDYYGGPNGTDDFGFSAVPGYSIDPGGNSYQGLPNGYWWSSTEYEWSLYNSANHIYLGHSIETVSNTQLLKGFAASVRCVKD